MVMSTIRKGGVGTVIKYVIFGLLTLAVGGMVFSDVGGFFRNGGVSNSDAARVGEQTISLQAFDRTARRMLQSMGMTTEQAYQMGYLREMLRAEVNTRLISQKAAEIGIAPSKEKVIEKVQTLVAPMTAPGQKPHEVLAQLLQAQGLSEQELTQTLKREMAVTMLGDAVKAGFADVSDSLVSDLATYEKETRTLEFITFADKDFTEVKKPEEADLKQMYEALKEGFSKPELREGQLIIIKTASLKDTLEITDNALREEYDRNIAQYSEPQTRTLEIALIADKAKAQKVADAVKAGKSLTAATKEITGNTTDVLPERAFAEKELNEQIRPIVMAAKAGDVLGPLDTPLGPQVAVLKSINPARTIPFEDVKADLRKDMQESKLADAQFELGNAIDDALASGSSAEDVKARFDVEIKPVPAMTALGTDAKGKPAASEFAAVGDKVLRALYELGEGEASSVFDLPDGNQGVVILKTITPKSYLPFEEVKDKLAKQWTEENRTTENKLQVLKILAEAKTENMDLKELAAKYKKQTQSAAGLTRSKEPQAPLTPASLGSIFEAPKGELIALDIAGGAALARVTSINTEGEFSAEEMSKARTNIIRSAQNESYDLFLQAAQKKFPTRVNEQALEQLYGQKQE